jgi:hypothetical protein
MGGKSCAQKGGSFQPSCVKSATCGWPTRITGLTLSRNPLRYRISKIGIEGNEAE